LIIKYCHQSGLPNPTYSNHNQNIEIIVLKVFQNLVNHFIKAQLQVIVMLEDFPTFGKDSHVKKKTTFHTYMNILECVCSPKKSLVEPLQKNFTKKST